MSLVARHLEANGIPTVIVGCAKDIVEHAGVPRFVFSDFPLGNPCGRPFDVAMQHGILDIALGVLESARYPRTTVQTPYLWSTDHAWKLRFSEGHGAPVWELEERGSPGATARMAEAVVGD